MSSTADLEGSARRSPWKIVVALRPAHWVKNLLLAAPLVFGQVELTGPLAARIAVAFLAMCLAASAGYLINDIADRAADRLHAAKRRRPLAAGRIGASQAAVAAALLAACSLGLALLVDARIAVLVLLYLVGTVSYTLFFKKLPVVDVTLLSGLYVWRMVIGGELAELTLSWWMIVFAYTLFLTLALAKRIDELAVGPAGSGKRVPGRPYGHEHLRGLRLACVALTLASIAAVMAYVGFSHAAHTYYHSPPWLWIAAIALGLWLTRIVHLAMAGRLAGDPVLFSASDPRSLLLAAGAALALIAAM